MLDITEYRLTAAVSHPVTFALVTDLHDQPYDTILAAIRERKPDFTAAAGDIIEVREDGQRRGLAFLSACAGEMPVFYAPGNHEYTLSEEAVSAVRRTGAVFLKNASVRLGELNIGGVSAECDLSEEAQRFLDAYCRQEGFRILLCHQPLRYVRYLRAYDIPVVLSGHAHGGQVRLFGRGLWAPQEGLFPKWTQGVFENRLVVSRGLGNHVPAPRIWNRPELCFVTLFPGSAGKTE